MSEGRVIPMDEAMQMTNVFISLISPYCERIEIAGSLRRGKPEVHDIEIVAEPKDRGMK